MVGKFVDYFKHFERKSLFLQWYDRQPISTKIGFFSAFVIALLTHLVIYSTHTLEIHLPGFIRVTENNITGRWMHHYVNGLNFYYMNWVTGLMQVLFLSIIVFLVLKTFDIQNRLYALLIAGVFVTFPAVAETNLFFHDAAPYFMAALLSIAGYSVTKMYKYGWSIGIILIMSSLAIYQSKISLAMTASLIQLILFLLKENPTVKIFVRYAIRYVFLILGGLVAYYFSLQWLGLSPTHRGMENLTLSNLYEDVIRAYGEIYYYFFSNSFRIENNFLTVAYSFLGIMGLSLLILATKKYLGKSCVNWALITLLIILLPFASNFSRIFDAGDIGALTMTSYAFVFFLIFPLILYENLGMKLNTFGLKKCVAVALIFITCYYISFSNFIYQREVVLTQHVVQFANRLAMRIEPLLPYSDNSQVFISGNLSTNPLYQEARVFGEYRPRTSATRLIGNPNNFASWPQNYFNNVIRYRVGVDFNQIGSNERRQYLLDQAITIGMPVYPQEGSIAIIDGVVVAMLNFYGQIDVRETTPSSFRATANHTGKTSDLDFEYIWYLYKGGQRVEQIYRDYYGVGCIDYEINEPGMYHFRVYVRLDSERNIINFFSRKFEVR